MRNIKIFILYIFVFIFNSCCTQKYCEEWIDKIEIINFTDAEADSIIIKSYQGNSNFTELVDSSFTSGVYTTDFPDKRIIYLMHNLSFDLAYKIEVVSTNSSYTISGFTRKKEDCNSCYPSGHTSYDVLDKYYVNGNEKHSFNSDLIIEK